MEIWREFGGAIFGPTEHRSKCISGKLQSVFREKSRSSERKNVSCQLRSPEVQIYLDGPVIRDADRGDSRESIRRKKNLFSSRLRRFARIDSNLRFASLSPRSGIRKNGVQFGNPETIREKQATRANLRIDSRDSGHLSSSNIIALHCCNK